ncbi:hypothetical protein HMI56_001542 [Coelomomyces lativittatus]|nr:hypothetical protein HMI56_001542 [Coelomomyces lativittatus]
MPSMTPLSSIYPEYTYLDIHLYFTLPTLLVILFLVRPILHSLAIVKLCILSILAFLYTTPWDNFILAFDAWSYCPKCVLFTVGYVPFEEYMFFIIQTWLSGLIATFIFHFSPSPTHLLFKTQLLKNTKTIRVLGALFLLTVGVLHMYICTPGSPYFYFACIVWWSMPVIALQWYVAGHFILAQARNVAIAVLVPTFYLSLVDTFALQRNVWTITPKSILEIYLLKDFPLEEFFFFFITNVMLGEPVYK